MSSSEPSSGPSFSREEIEAAMDKKLEKYKGRSFLEQFAMFMGFAQILEIGLKNMLQREHGISGEKMLRWTLGRTAQKMREYNVRPDFCGLLESLVEKRNYVAHELIASELLLRSLLGNVQATFGWDELKKGILELEHLMVLAEWCDEHDAWM